MQDQINNLQNFQKKHKKDLNSQVKSLSLYVEEELKKRGRQRNDSYTDDSEYDDSYLDLNGYKQKAMKMRRTHSFKNLSKRHETQT